ncbi:hypothetical protein EV195_11124 [Tenacibaculum skagerrakense]|uniref:Uncharacterized protein n=1 Tax=Tenacibaculum skagerrakense TaxID=186571 RepID=A0A4V2SLA0_9FLAO|nr:hypothetical protein [Tenacibaculum skagerrakense]TCP22596.1 hypothetical protein EV195_11124 [Tenacibaculum skagerrakense]
MASVKNLKKDINYTLGDIIGECNVWELENPNEDASKSQAIIDEAISTFDELIAKVHVKDVENKKAHFKSINAELETRANALVGKLNAL